MEAIMPWKKLFLMPVLLLALTACENSTPKLVGDPPRPPRKSQGSEVQTFNPAVDILFVIDDSGSMSSHQNLLKDNVELFTKGLAANKFVDFHIGVITTSDTFSDYTDSGGGALVGKVKYIERSTLMGFDFLKENILVGTSGDYIEKVFSPLIKALTEPMLSGTNQGFYRPSAFLAVVVITDAEDQSVTADPVDAHQFLLDLKGGDSTKILSYGAIIPTNDKTDCSRDDYNKPPTRIEEFFSLSNGQSFGLCDTDYGTKLGRIGADLVERIGRRVLLDRRPILESIEVTYGTQIIEPHPQTGWYYDGRDNAIILGSDIAWSEQPEGTTVEVYSIPAQ